ncbi:hypothetical protein [Streptomyces luteogriseus]|uniref:hypothetical protein n=1 Tax=Streptomyces luteogriseus TaxID=68233 RepID=UPI002620C74F|nr:hypothetical protein [uncultured Streptomyces sp.]
MPQDSGETPCPDIGHHARPAINRSVDAPYDPAVDPAVDRPWRGLQILARTSMAATTA